MASTLAVNQSNLKSSRLQSRKQKYWNHGASLFAFENNSHVWDAHWFCVHPCIDIPKNLRGKLPVLLLRSNIPAAVIRHAVLGKRSLVRDPTCIMTYKSTSRL